MNRLVISCVAKTVEQTGYVAIARQRGSTTTQSTSRSLNGEQSTVVGEDIHAKRRRVSSEVWNAEGKSDAELVAEYKQYKKSCEETQRRCHSSTELEELVFIVILIHIILVQCVE